MNPQSLLAISPIDGRYQAKVDTLTQYFSEYALIKYRAKVEVAYLHALKKTDIPQLAAVSEQQLTQLLNRVDAFSLEDAILVKEIEATINHDVKAIEYFVKQLLDEVGLYEVKEFVHFGLTSQDINNVAIPLMLKDAWLQVILPAIQDLIDYIHQMALEHREVAMLARTHGQPASPTTLGKELLVFATRLKDMLKLQSNIPHRAKFGGATGNFNAHHVAYPHINWHAFADEFIARLGLERTRYTTQIEPYDHLAAFCQGICRINTVLIDFNRDVWQYISMDYFRQKANPKEVGSSAMPHKVNPIDFENAEGNLGIANAILYHLAEKLPISRLQRDLTDSTVLRNLGLPFAHSLLAYKSVVIGLRKLTVNQKVISFDLQKYCVVVLEGIQTILRREGYPNPYEEIKALFRGGDEVTMESIHRFIDSLQVSTHIKEELFNIKPETYIGPTLQ
jgi:adenylosuccinate lyase